MKLNREKVALAIISVFIVVVSAAFFGLYAKTAKAQTLYQPALPIFGQTPPEHSPIPSSGNGGQGGQFVHHIETAAKGGTPVRVTSATIDRAAAAAAALPSPAPGRVGERLVAVGGQVGIGAAFGFRLFRGVDGSLAIASPVQKPGSVAFEVGASERW